MDEETKDEIMKIIINTGLFTVAAFLIGFITQPVGAENTPPVSPAKSSKTNVLKDKVPLVAPQNQLVTTPPSLHGVHVPPKNKQATKKESPCKKSRIIRAGQSC